MFFQRHLAQFKHRAATGIVHQFGEGVRQTTRAHVVNGDNRIAAAQLPAAVDHFLRTAFDFGVAALHRVEVQIGGIAAGIHRRSGAAAQTDQHAGAAELNQQCAFGNAVFMGLLRLDIAQTAGNHNRLVIAAHAAVVFGFKGAEIAEQVGAAEFVVERRAAQRAVDYDVER